MKRTNWIKPIRRVSIWRWIRGASLSRAVRGGRGPQSIPLADFTLLLSTTDEYALLQPLRDRMKLLLRFDFCTPEELTEILRHRSRALCWKLDERVFPLIARRSRGTPRLALRLLQACRRVCRAEGETAITLAHLERACLLEQIDHAWPRPDRPAVPPHPGRRSQPAERHCVPARPAHPHRRRGHGAVLDPGRAGGEGRSGPASVDRRRP